MAERGGLDPQTRRSHRFSRPGQLLLVHVPKWWPRSESNRHLRLFRPALRPHQLQGQDGGRCGSSTHDPLRDARLAGGYEAATLDGPSRKSVVCARLQHCRSASRHWGLTPPRHTPEMARDLRLELSKTGFGGQSAPCASRIWCARRDSNSDVVRHQALNLTGLPVPPRARKRWCGRWESNPHALRHLGLSQTRLPLRHDRKMVSWERFELSHPKATASETVLSTSSSTRT